MDIARLCSGSGATNVATPRTLLVPESSHFYFHMLWSSSFNFRCCILIEVEHLGSVVLKSIRVRPPILLDAILLNAKHHASVPFERLKMSHQKSGLRPQFLHQKTTAWPTSMRSKALAELSWTLWARISIFEIFNIQEYRLPRLQKNRKGATVVPFFPSPLLDVLLW